MIVGNMEFDNVAVCDTNGAVIAVIADDKCIVYDGAQILGNATFRDDVDIVYAEGAVFD